MGGFSSASTSPFDGDEDLLSDAEGPAKVRADGWCAAEYVSFEFQIFAMLEPRPTNSQASGGTAQTPATNAQASGSSTCKMEKQCRKQMSGKVVLLPPFCLFVYLYIFLFIYFSLTEF
jgi:hypothetical protein